MTEFVPICQATLLEIKTATETDAEFGLLTAVIKQGWPETKGVLSPSIQDYFPFREELTAQNGIMFKGGRINVVPHCLRECIIDKVHASHLGIQACLGRAKEAFYWLRFYKQISEFISNCTICNSYKPTQQKEPLVRDEIPTRLWQSISADLSEFHGTDSLITTDDYSNFFEQGVLTGKTSKEVIDKLKPHFARYGLPDKITTDNGPQFNCTEFQKFTKDFQFRHIKTSPRYPQSNWKAENSVCTEDGRLYHCNRSHLYKVPENYQPIPDCELVWSKGISLNLPSSLNCEDPVVVPDVSPAAFTTRYLWGPCSVCIYIRDLSSTGTWWPGGHRTSGLVRNSVN